MEKSGTQDCSNFMIYLIAALFFLTGSGLLGLDLYARFIAPKPTYTPSGNLINLSNNSVLHMVQQYNTYMIYIYAVAFVLAMIFFLYGKFKCPKDSVIMSNDE